MLDPEVHYCIAIINYCAMHGKTINDKMNRILGEFIYDPLSKVSPLERVSQIREALASDEKLSQPGVTPTRRQSEEDCRALLTQLVDRIEFYESNGLPLFEDINKLTEKQLEELRILLQPLRETSTLSDAIKIFEEKVLPTLHSYKDSMDAVVLIRYLLWFDTSKILPLFFTPEVTDSTVREYLRNIAWKIEDAREHQNVVAEE
jgi:hypothetical protein